MLSETLASGLKAYQIGAKVRALRSRKGLGLVQLGEHTGLSPALLSKIERDQLFPTLPTLLRIALVFGVGLDHFFVDSKDRPMIAVVRKKDRLRLPERPGEPSPSYVFESLDFPVPDRKSEAFYAEFENEERTSSPHEHTGTELIYVLGGQLVVDVGGEETTLGPGDAMTFDSGHPHGYRRRGRARCSAIVVVTP
jgi:transcriptional regulator with XRE-family HTH domain